MTCPHGDAFCPCPDGLACHYEPPDPMPCPAGATTPHCHLEGCAWTGAGQCGLVAVGLGAVVSCEDAYTAGCGAIRNLVAAVVAP